MDKPSANLAALIAFHAQTASRELTVIRPLRVAAQARFDEVGLPRGLAKVA